jgi:hypothetical protein
MPNQSINLTRERSRGFLLCVVASRRLRNSERLLSSAILPKICQAQKVAKWKSFLLKSSSILDCRHDTFNWSALASSWKISHSDCTFQTAMA